MKTTKLIILFYFFTLQIIGQEQPVEVNVFKQNFPTYTMGPDQDMPYLKDFNVKGLKFFRGSRSVYPYTFLNDYKPEKVDKDYEVVRLENEFIYIDIIPELRGRIQGAVDKRNNWDFLYYNHVIKPAEVSVRSAWISGGLEHNHPQGHGYTQFEKISYDIKNNADGSVTVIVAEIEPVRMFKWEFEITLRPGELYFETKGRFISTKPFKVPFLSSNNAAMHTSKEMQLIYPQETHASGHGFKSMKKWPYFGSENTDWNWLKNIKTPASVFVDGAGLYTDYWGVYSHDTHIDAGTVMVADHRVAPGKKYFTWGIHEGGKQWDTFLSDTDGGYVELQQQAYYSNLGYGYAILDPFEVKEFSVYWYPIKSTGGFVKANKEMAVNLSRLNNTQVKLDIQPTIKRLNTTVEIYKNNTRVSAFKSDFIVGDVINKTLNIKSIDTDTLELRITSDKQKELMSYKTKIPEIAPEVNKLPETEKDQLTIDQLYAKGMSFYHDPYGKEAESYFREALKRDALDSRTNRQLGVMYIKRGQFKEAIKHLKTSLKNDHFESHFDTYFLLGTAYLELDDLKNAYVNFIQSSRKKSKLEGALYYLAKIKIIENDYDEALRFLEEIPVSRLTHPKIYNLKSYVYRKLGDNKLAYQNIENTYAIDPLDFVSLIEQLSLKPENNKAITDKINFLFDREDVTFVGSQLYLETAEYYLKLGDYNTALNILNIADNHYQSKNYPVIDYYMGYCLKKLGNKEQALNKYKKASKASYDNVFLYKVKSIEVLEDVISEYPNDAIAKMYYGDLLYYLHRHDEALKLWRASYELNKNNSRNTRNLAIGLFVKNNSLDESIPLLEEAYRNSEKNQRIFNELEQFYRLANYDDKLENHYDNNWGVLNRKGDFALRASDFYLRKERYTDALKVLQNTFFNAVEYGMGQPKRHSRYAEACIGLGKSFMNKKDYDSAISWYLKAYEYPAYLDEVEVSKPVTIRLDYLLGMAFKAKGNKLKSKAYFKKACNQDYNIISEDAIYRAKALEVLGKSEESKVQIKKLFDAIEKPHEPIGVSRHNPESSYGIEDYITSVAYGFLGDTKKEKAFLDKALAVNKDVVMITRFNSSFIKIRR